MTQQILFVFLCLLLRPAIISAYSPLPSPPSPCSPPPYEPPNPSPPPPSPSPPPPSPPPPPPSPPPPSPSPPPPSPPPPSPSPPPPSPSPPPPPPPSSSPPAICYPYSSVTCKGNIYPTYTCSPLLSTYTRAILTVYDFSRNGDGYGPSKCDGKYKDNSDDLVVALSTGWYAGGSRCGKTIYIQAKNGKTTLAKVVDECDSTRGCDREHNRPCGNNYVGGSKAVWKALGLDRDDEKVAIVWSIAY